MAINTYDTVYLMAAVEEMQKEHAFFRNRYFPTNTSMDIFGTSKVLADYREDTQKLAPFVVPRIGSLPVGREGYSTFELEPPHIGLSMPLTADQLKKRGFGESLMSQLTPEDRARILQIADLSELDKRITRTEEWMACQTMLNNGLTMRHMTDVKDVYEDVPVQFYEGTTNPAEYTPAKKWAHSTVNATTGDVTVGNWYNDVCAMIAKLKKRGLPATDLLVSSDVGDFLMSDPWVLKMLDNRRAEMGHIQPSELTEYVTYLGSFNFKGRLLDIIVSDGSYDKDGTDTAYLDDGSVIVTAPGAGRCLYGAQTQLENDGEFHTYAGTRIPQHLFTIKPPVKETQLCANPLMVPNRKSPWTTAKKVLTL